MLAKISHKNITNILHQHKTTNVYELMVRGNLVNDISDLSLKDLSSKITNSKGKRQVTKYVCQYIFAYITLWIHTKMTKYNVCFVTLPKPYYLLTHKVNNKCEILLAKNVSLENVDMQLNLISLEVLKIVDLKIPIIKSGILYTLYLDTNDTQSDFCVGKDLMKISTNDVEALLKKLKKKIPYLKLDGSLCSLQGKTQDQFLEDIKGLDV